MPFGIYFIYLNCSDRLAFYAKTFINIKIRFLSMYKLIPMDNNKLRNTKLLSMIFVTQ